MAHEGDNTPSESDFSRMGEEAAQRARDAQMRGDTQGMIWAYRGAILAGTAAALAFLQSQIATGNY